MGIHRLLRHGETPDRKIGFRVKGLGFRDRKMGLGFRVTSPIPEGFIGSGPCVLGAGFPLEKGPLAFLQSPV